MAVALPLAVAGRDDPQLLLSLPLGLRRAWLTKLAASLILLGFVG